MLLNRRICLQKSSDILRPSLFQQVWCLVYMELEVKRFLLFSLFIFSYFIDKEIDVKILCGSVVLILLYINFDDVYHLFIIKFYGFNLLL